MIVIALMNFPPLPQFSELRTRLLAFEGQQTFAAQMVASPLAAFVAVRPPRDSPAMRPRDQAGPQPQFVLSMGLDRLPIEPNVRSSMPKIF